jgi:branched-subunit amino acid aminotransferase/4-amino-4-deoxychorismate lyase
LQTRQILFNRKFKYQFKVTDIYRINDRKASKLALNLERLAKASLNLSHGLKEQHQEMQDKQKQVLLKQQQAGIEMECKLSVFKDLKNCIQKE